MGCLPPRGSVPLLLRPWVAVYHRSANLPVQRRHHLRRRRRRRQLLLPLQKLLQWPLTRKHCRSFVGAANMDVRMSPTVTVQGRCDAQCVGDVAHTGGLALDDGPTLQLQQLLLQRPLLPTFLDAAATANRAAVHSPGHLPPAPLPLVQPILPPLLGRHLYDGGYFYASPSSPSPMSSHRVSVFPTWTQTMTRPVVPVLVLAQHHPSTSTRRDRQHARHYHHCPQAGGTGGCWLPLRAP